MIKEKTVLFNIIKHCKRVEEKVSSITKAEFDENMDIKEICCFNIFQIGELAKRLSDQFVLKYNKVPWKDIKGNRDVIGHGYGSIDYNDIWNTSTKEIKPLRLYCEEILKTL